MIHISTHSWIFPKSNNDQSGSLYAVFDSCVMDSEPSKDFAFIEERPYSSIHTEYLDEGEHYFSSLSEAKSYVNRNFCSGAEYFSLKQSYKPDNFFLIILDKITYLMA